MIEQLTPNQFPDPYLVALSRRGTARKLRDKISKFFFGDDIFVSYARADATEYAASLAARLTKRKFICYLDQFGSLPEAEMPTRLKQKLMRSTAVVLIGTTKAVASMNVRKEIEMFTLTGRPIIPLNVEGTLLRATDWKELVGLAKIPEKGERVVSGNPSPRVVNLIKDSFRYRRRNQWQRLFLFAGSAFVVLAVGSASLWAGNRVAKANEVAATSEKKAGDAENKAASATVSEGKAKEAALLASLQELMARVNTGIAAIQQKLAETGMKQAQLKEEQAKERAAVTARQEAGQRATVLARTPGREFDALEIAVKAAHAEFKQRSPASQVVTGLVAAVSAAGDGIPLQQTDGEVTYATISPDAQRVFVETFNRNTNTAKWGLWNARTGEPLTKEPIFVKKRESSFLPTQGFRPSSPFVASACFSRDGNRLAVAGGSGAPSIQIWDLKGEKAPINLPIDFANVSPYRMALDNDGSHLAIVFGDNSGFVTVKTVDDKSTEKIPHPLGGLISLAYRKNNTLQIIGETQIVDSSTQQVSAITKTSDRFLGLSSDDLFIYWFSPEFGRPEDRVLPADFQLIYVKDDGPQYFKNLFSGFSGAIASATVLDGHPYVVTINGTQARIYGASSDAGSITLRSRDRITYSAISPDGSLAATVSSGEVGIWNLKTGQPVQKLRAEFIGPVFAMAFSDDSRRLALLDSGRMVADVFDLETGKNLSAPLGRCQAVNEEGAGDYLGFLNQPRSISFLHGNEQYVTMHRGGVVAVWNVNNCEPTTIKLEDNVTLVALSGDGGSALTVSKGTDRSVKIWDLSNLAHPPGEGSKLPSHNLGQLPTGRVRAAWVDHTKARLLLSNDDWNLEIWEAGLTTPRRLSCVDGEIYSAVFSEDGSSLSIVTKDGYVSGATGVWDVNSGEKRIAIPGKFLISYNRDPVKLSRDGAYLLAAHTDYTARIYPATKQGFLNLATRILARASHERGDVSLPNPNSEKCPQH